MPDQIDNKYRVAAEFTAISNPQPLKKRKRDKLKSSNTKKFLDLVQENLSDTKTAPVTFEADALADDETLIKLRDEVFSRGDFLKNKVTLETIKDYKQAVSNFLSYFISHTYEFKKTPERRTSFRVPKSSTIRLINEKLEKLANEVFSNQAKQLDILERVDEIKGLVIDLLQ